MEDNYGVRGGQGRTPKELHESSLIWAIMILLAAVCMFLLPGCVPTSHTKQGNDERLYPNRPSHQELRHLNTL